MRLQGRRGFRVGRFDARSKIGSTSDLRLRLGGDGRARSRNNTFKQALQGLLSPSRVRANSNISRRGRGRGGIRSRGMAFNSGINTKSSRRPMNFDNFTVVAPAPLTRGTARTRPVKLRRPVAPQLKTVPSRTIDNARITVSKGGVSKTIINDVTAHERIQNFSIRKSVANPLTYTPQSIAQRNFPAKVPSKVGVFGRNSAGVLANEPHYDSYVNVDDDDDEAMDMSMGEPIATRRSNRPIIKERLGQPKPINVKGFRLLVTNLHTGVTQDDVKELFTNVGSSLIRSRLIESGLAEAIYANRSDALEAVKTYNDRELDGIPMKIQLMNDSEDKPQLEIPVKTGKVPVRVKAPATSTTIKDELQPAAKSKFTKLITNTGRKDGTGPEPDRGLITQALFPNKTDPNQNVTFTVKI